MAFIVSRFTQIHKLLLMLLDFLLFLVASGVAHSWRFGEFGVDFLAEPLFWLVALATLCSLYIFGAYELEDRETVRSQATRILFSLGLSLLFTLCLTFLLGQKHLGYFGRGVLLGSLTLFFILSSGPRILFCYFGQNYRRSLHWLFIVSAKARVIIEKDLKENAFPGQVTFLDVQDLSIQRVRELHWNALVLALEEPQLQDSLVGELMRERLNGQHVIDVCDFYETYWKKVPVDFLHNSWFILSQGFRLVENPVSVRVKRLMDFILATGMLLIVWPLMLLTAIIVRLDSPGAALFKQKRVGMKGREFTIYKFRSMVSDAERNGAQWAQKNDSRVTRVGAFIRNTRLDELPQLFNVIRGEMSFVGPRPERAEFDEKIEKVVPFYRVRQLVRPGLTGWAQVLFPYGASIEDAKEKLQYEIFYIKNYSLVLDMIILLKTVSVVLLGRGR